MTLAPAQTPAAQASQQTGTQTEAGRVGALDGLRGIGCLVVLFVHCAALASPDFALFIAGPVNYPTGTVSWFAVRTPLHIFLAGQEMVLMFFVLSGYVLARPAATWGVKWFNAGYYPRRFIRLYLPTMAAFGVAACLHALHRSVIPGASWMLNDSAGPLTFPMALHDAALFSPKATAALDPVSWTLHYEVVFSLLLPLFIAIALFARRRRMTVWILVGLCFLEMFIVEAGLQGRTLGSLPPALRLDPYEPLFMLGCLLALAMPKPRLRSADGWRSKVVLAGLLICCALLLTSTELVGVSHSYKVDGIRYVLDALGACMIVWLALAWRPVATALTRRPTLWLGSRSFSLYLIHFPVVTELEHLLGNQPTVLPLFAIGVPASLVSAEIFWRLVEQPTLRLSHRTAARVNSMFAERRRTRLEAASG